MGYVRQNLMPGEQIMYETTLHWKIFLSPIIVGLLGTVFFVIALASDISEAWWACCLSMFVFLLAILSFVSAAISYATSEFAVTNKRVLAKVGFIRRHSSELLLTQVEGIRVHQGIMGRLLGYGTTVVTGTGGTEGVFKNIADPLGFRKQVQSQIHTL